jgi:transcriptional regulator with XRE-family HTH domain
VINRLAELRKSKTWSMQETADQLGIAKSTYAGYESGYREPSLKALSQIADLFETSVDYILNRVNHKNPNLEITEILKSNGIILSIDKVSLTTEELCDFIAFTRLKRTVKKSLD